MNMATKSPLPPVGLHEDVISRHYGRDPATGAVLDDPEISALAAAAAYGRETCAKALTTHAAIIANPMATDIANERQARDALYTMQQSAAKRIDGAVARANSERKTILSKIHAPPRPTDISGVVVASEIRSAFATMSPSKRRATIESALANDEDEVISALLHAPSLTTGLSAAERETLRASWQRRCYPAEVARAIRLESAMNDLCRGGEAMMRFIRSLTDAGRIEVAEEKERIAQAAHSAAI